MSIQPGAVLNTVAFGNRPEGVEVPVIQTRNPQTYDWNYPLGKRWVNKSANTCYELTSITQSGGVNTATWTALGGGTVAISTINSNAPVSGNYVLAGTANQITATDTAGTTTFSVPSSFVAPGSIAATTTVTATLGNITATNGNLSLATAGNKIIIATGANASVGTSAAMTAGAVTVSTTACSATAKIFYSRATTGGTPGNVSITAQDGTGFTLTSTSGTETSTFNWWIINA